MRPVYRRLTALGVALMILVVGFPGEASAANAQCAVLLAKRERLNQEMQTKQAALGEVRVKNKFSLPQTSSVTQQKIAVARQKTDAKRADIYKKLEAKVKTAAQKAALQTYKTEIEAAVSARRAAHDTARTTFVTAVNNLFTTHRASVEASFTVLKAQYDKAFATAAATCEKAGLEKTTLQLKSDIAAAEKSFASTSSIAPGEMSSAIKNFADARQASITSANQVFQEAIGAARLKLETALGKNTKNILKPERD